MKRVSYSIFIACAVALLSSCVSQQRKLSYLRDVDASSADTVNATYQSIKEAHITAGDVLTILVNAMDLEAVQVFNMPIANTHRLTSTSALGRTSLQGYWVNPQGNINFPVLGELHVAGLTTTELQDTLEVLISQSVKNPIVNVDFQNFYVTVLGQVRNPGRYNVNDQHMTIFDALALAGDMNIYGKRDNVLVSREVDGKMEFARLNLNDHSVFASPYYHIRQNDVIYVESNTAHAAVSQNIPLYLSVLTTLGSMTTVIIAVVKLAK